MGFFDFVDIVADPFRWATGAATSAVANASGNDTIKKVGNVISTSTDLGKSVGAIGKATGSQTVGDIGKTLEKPIASAAGFLAGPQGDPKKPMAVPPPPTPSDPEVASELEKAQRNARRPSGQASSYLANPSLLDQPGTFFRSSLGG